MDITFKQVKRVSWLASVTMILLIVFSTISLAQGGGRYYVEPWSFGVHGDTQWTVGQDPEGANPDYVSAAVAGALNEQFIDYGVKFVIQVGDLSDQAGNDAMYSRAATAQPLYDAGIGFFPLRGNHETYGDLFGRDPDLDMNIPAYLDAFPQTQGLANTFGATNFSSPAIPDLNGLSYSFDYGIPTNNARFVIVDTEVTSYWEKPADPHPIYGPGYDWPTTFVFGPFWVVYKYTEDLYGEIGDDVMGTIPAGSWFRINSSGDPSIYFYGWEVFWPFDTNTAPQAPKWVSEGTEFFPGDQQEWISAQLDKTTRGTEHAFVLSHRGLMGANHVDSMFGSNPGSKASDQNVFYASLQDNDVKFTIFGHDHLHNHSIVASPDGESYVEQLICTGASTKFYEPGSLNSFITYYGDVKQREIQISQEIFNIGYYIYTVDGPRVTVDYFSDSVGNFQDNGEYPRGDDSFPARLYLPEFDFVKKETWGYSLNGQQFLVAQGGSYTAVEDSFGETTAKILAGTNNSTTTDYTPVIIDDNDTPEDPIDDTILSAPRPLYKVVNTGWVENPDHNKLKSDILSLWGMSELGAEEQTDIYVLCMSFDFNKMIHLGNGGIGIATYAGGEWINAVNENFGGKKKFVVGKYKPGYGLGTYGVDPSTKTAWAVLNYNADFAVAMDIEPVPGHRK